MKSEPVSAATILSKVKAYAVPLGSKVPFWDYLVGSKYKPQTGTTMEPTSRVYAVRFRVVDLRSWVAKALQGLSQNLRKGFRRALH